MVYRFWGNFEYESMTDAPSSARQELVIQCPGRRATGLSMEAFNASISRHGALGEKVSRESTTRSDNREKHTSAHKLMVLTIGQQSSADGYCIHGTLRLLGGTRLGAREKHAPKG